MAAAVAEANLVWQIHKLYERNQMKSAKARLKSRPNLFYLTFMLMNMMPKKEQACQARL